MMSSGYYIIMCNGRDGGEKRSEIEAKKGNIYPTECRVPEIAKRDIKSFLNEQ